MHRIAFLLCVSAQAVRNWIRPFAKDHGAKPVPTGSTIVLELDEMWHYLKNKRQKLWSWKASDCDTGQLLDWDAGGARRQQCRSWSSAWPQGTCICTAWTIG